MDILLIPFSFCFARALGLVAFLPFEIITQGLGLRVLIAVLIALTGLNRVSELEDLGMLSYLLEFMLGFICALPVVLIIHAADLWGDLYESLRGQTAGSIADPLFQGETSHLALLTKNLIWVGLISVGVLETLLVQYLKSFNLSALDISLWQKSILLFAQVLNAAMELVLPFACLFLVVESVAMFAAKLLPAVTMQTEIFTAKMLLGGAGLLYLLGLEPLSSLQIVLNKLFL